ncbi:MAG: hypothetical protein ACR2QK_03425 [Acidimicrobiales bacterium]
MKSSTTAPLRMLSVAGVAHLCVFWSFAAHPLVGLALLPLFAGAMMADSQGSRTVAWLVAVATVAFGLTVGLVVSGLFVLLLAALIAAAAAGFHRAQLDSRAVTDRPTAHAQSHGVDWLSVQMIGW